MLRAGAPCARGAGRYAVRGSGRACDAVVRWGGGLGWERGEGVLCVLVWGSMELFFLGYGGRGGRYRGLVDGKGGLVAFAGGCRWIGGLVAGFGKLGNLSCRCDI